MVSETQQIKLLVFFRKYTLHALVLILMAGNVYQYVKGREDHEEFRAFQKEVYNNELKRVSKWEDIILTLQRR